MTNQESRVGCHTHALLAEIIILHPARLTAPELILRMGAKPYGSDKVLTEDSLQELMRDGLIRQSGPVLEPTYAALRAAAFLEPDLIPG
jgi:hypothetical protein